MANFTKPKHTERFRYIAPVGSIILGSTPFVIRYSDERWSLVTSRKNDFEILPHSSIYYLQAPAKPREGWLDLPQEPGSIIRAWLYTQRDPQVLRLDETSSWYGFATGVGYDYISRQNAGLTIERFVRLVEES